MHYDLPESVRKKLINIVVELGLTGPIGGRVRTISRPPTTSPLEPRGGGLKSIRFSTLSVERYYYLREILPLLSSTFQTSRVRIFSVR